jgi:competence protein ComEC
MPETSRSQRRLLAFVFVTALTAVLSWCGWSSILPAPRIMRVTFLDVGQGDAIVVETPGGRRLVVDTGPRSETTSQGLLTVVPYLRSTGAQVIDALLLTHADSDHVGGAPDLLQTMEVRRLVVSGEGEESAAMREVLQTARRRGVEIVRIRRGQGLDFRDGVIAQVIHPQSGHLAKEERDNNASLVLRLRYMSTSLVLTGDAEEGAEQRMILSRQPLGADILKIGHHGSRTSTSPEFLRAVHPQAAVISCGRHNAFGHPHAQITSRLDEAAIPVFRTDRDGAIMVESDGRTIRIRKSVHAR